MTKDKRQITFALTGVKVNNFSLNLPEEIQHSNLTFDIGLERTFDIDNETVILSIPIVMYLHKDSTDETNIGTIKTSFIFHIHNMKDLLSGERVNIPKELMGTFVNIAYATTRGILFEKSASSSIGNVILPLVSPVKLLEKTDPEIYKND